MSDGFEITKKSSHITRHLARNSLRYQQRIGISATFIKLWLPEDERDFAISQDNPLTQAKW